jgi:EpsI family protein
MTSTSRLIVLNAVVLAVLSLVFVLPSSPKAQPVGVNMRLPDFVGDWYGTDQKVTQKEIDVLGPGTDFSRKSYTNGRGDELYVSIVLGGQDMNTSIHRPERCLPAQGWTMLDSSSRSIAIPTPDHTVLNVTRLHNVRPLISDKGEPIIQNGEPVKIFNINYYWFAGLTDTTNSHWTRTWYDTRDRVLHGFNQRWAYITVSATITDNLSSFGRNEKQTDQVVQDFIRQLVPFVHGPTLPGGKK